MYPGSGWTPPSASTTFAIMAVTAPRPRAQRTGPPLTSAFVRGQVVPRPLGYLVQGGHEGPAPLGQLVGDGHRGAVADRAGDQAAAGQVAEPLGQDGVADPADPAGQVAEAGGPVRQVAEDDRGPALAQEAESAGQMLGRRLDLVGGAVFGGQNALLEDLAIDF